MAWRTEAGTLDAQDRAEADEAVAGALELAAAFRNRAAADLLTLVRAARLVARPRRHP